MLEAQEIALAATARVKLAPARRIIGIAAFAGKLAGLGAALRVELPVTPVRVSSNGTIFLWSGAQSWLAISGDPALETAITGAARGLAAVTDQSDGRVIFSVAGADVRCHLAKLVPIDLHERVFAPDATALTLAGHIPVQIWRGEDGGFELACFRSYADSLYHALIEAI